MASGGIHSAMTNRSLRTIKTELEFLAEASVITPQQYSSILSQLPADAASSVTSPAAENATSPMANLRVTSNDNSGTKKQNSSYFAPSPNIQQEEEHNIAPPAYPTAPQPPSVLVYASALYAYNATDAGDLNLITNDRVAVTEYMNAEWWKGRSERTGEEGIFPRSYVRVEEKTSAGRSTARYQKTAANASGASTDYGNMPLEVSQSGSDGPRQPGKGEENAKKFGKKLGNAAVFGAGATIGGKIVNGIF